MSNSTTYLQELSEVLARLVEQSFQQSGKVSFSQDPAIETKSIMEYNRRMRVSGLEKFNGAAYVASVSFYRNDKDQASHNACGALVLNVADQEMKKLFEALGVSGFDDDEEDEAVEKCCEVCQTVADAFINQLQAKRSTSVLRSDAIGGRNTIADGVEFGYDQYDAQEISFYVKGQKVLAFDLTMSRL